MGIFSHNFKKFFVGEPMPDKNDPKYKERYERDVAAGQRFARASGLAWLGRHYCRWAENHKKLFFVLMLGSMTFFAAARESVSPPYVDETTAPPGAKAFIHFAVPQ